MHAVQSSTAEIYILSPRFCDSILLLFWKLAAVGLGKRTRENPLSGTSAQIRVSEMLPSFQYSQWATFPPPEVCVVPPSPSLSSEDVLHRCLL